MKKRFSIIQVCCEGCGKLQNPRSWTGLCPGCQAASFRVEIERSASGWQPYSLEEYLAGPRGSNGPSDPYWKTLSFLMCGGVSGDEITQFCAAPIDTRRTLYIAWKRRELEATLTPDHRICERCRVIYKIYENPWNRLGYCSRSCSHAALKSKK